MLYKMNISGNPISISGELPLQITSAPKYEIIPAAVATSSDGGVIPYVLSIISGDEAKDSSEAPVALAGRRQW